MTRQEAFNATARHLLTTRSPSGYMVGDHFLCVYSGSGCALRPFIPDTPTALDWDCIGAIADMRAMNDTPATVPDFISEDWDFFESLQDAHDKPAMKVNGDAAKWLPKWKDAMRAVAQKYRLDPSILDESETETHA